MPAGQINLLDQEIIAREGFDKSWLTSWPTDLSKWEAAPVINGKKSLRVVNLKKPGWQARSTFDYSRKPNKQVTYLFKLGPAKKEDLLEPRALYLATLAYNWQVFVNGQLVKEAMHVNEQTLEIKTHLYHRDILALFNAQLLHTDRENLLAIRIIGDPTMYITGSLRPGPFRMGAYEDLKGLSDETIDLILYGLYFFIGLYHLLLYARRPKENYNLFFACFTLVLTSYMFTRTGYVYSIVADSDIVRMWERFSLFLIMPGFNLFLESMCLGRVTRFGRIFMPVGFVFALLAFVPSIWFQITVLRTFQLSMGFFAVYVLYVLVKGLMITYKQNYGAESKTFKRVLQTLLLTPVGNLSLGVLILIFTALYDIVDAVFFFTHITFSRYGFLILISGVAVILANRFLNVHSESERLNVELTELNTNLERIVDERTLDLQQKTTRLEKATEELTLAKQETDIILQNVNEGVFLIDESFAISAAHSAELENIFTGYELSNLHFLELIESVAGEDIADTCRSFLNLLFKKKMPQRRLKKLNPLEMIEVNLENKGEEQNKFLRFDFNTIPGNESSALVTVQDITAEKNLAEQVQQAEEQSQIRMQLLYSIVRLKPTTVRPFLAEAADEIEYSIALVDELEKNNQLSLLNDLYRRVHTLKGNAQLLNIEVFAERLHVIESYIENLRGAGETRSELRPRLEDMQRIIEVAVETLDLVGNFQATAGDQGEFEAFLENLQQMVARVAEREGKQAQLDTTEFKPISLPAEIKKSITQIIRNAVVHGIETVDERRNAGKPDAGQISLRVGRDPLRNARVIEIRDDGRGINIGKIADSAVKSGRLTGGEVESMSKQQILQLIFQPNVSTRGSVSVDAGRGVGLDIVRDALKTIRGQIRVSFKEGLFSAFRLYIPAQK